MNDFLHEIDAARARLRDANLPPDAAGPRPQLLVGLATVVLLGVLLLLGGLVMFLAVSRFTP